MLLAEITAYHGTDKAHLTLRPPLFVTSNAKDAKWFAIERGPKGKGVILKGELTVDNPLKWLNPDDDKKVMAIAKKAGIALEENPYFYCADIAKHTKYDGTNPADLVYLPAFEKAVKKAGYDSIHMWDTLENTSIETYVIWDISKFKVESSELLESLASNKNLVTRMMNIILADNPGSSDDIIISEYKVNQHDNYLEFVLSVLIRPDSALGLMIDNETSDAAVEDRIQKVREKQKIKLEKKAKGAMLNLVQKLGKMPSLKFRGIQKSLPKRVLIKPEEATLDDMEYIVKLIFDLPLNSTDPA